MPPASCVPQDRLPTRAASQVLAPAPSVASGSSQLLLRRALALRVLPGYSSPLLVRACALHVQQARLRTRAANQVQAPALNAQQEHLRKLLRRAPAPSVLPGSFSPLLVKLCALIVTAARRAHARLVVAQLGATVLTAFLANTLMHLHRYVSAARRVSIKMQ